LSPGRITALLFYTKCAVPRQIKPGIVKLTIRRGQSNFSIVFIFAIASFEGKGHYRAVSMTVSVGQLRFDCRSYYGRNRRMQGYYMAHIFVRAPPGKYSEAGCQGGHQ